VLAHLDPASALAVGLLVFALIMVILFEATNGFHDAANAVATVIYTKSLQPTQAVILSGVLNFIGVLVGGIAVAYALVELLPAEVLSPPDGAPAVAMLVALFVAALFWNIGTWWLGLPNSSSHCLIGALIGVAIGDAFAHARNLSQGVQWAQLWTVLKALAVSPLLGFVLAGALYLIARKTVREPHLYQPAGEQPPVWWMRAVLVLTCSGVSFAHGTNDGQKSIGLIMLSIIGLFPAAFALNPQAGHALAALPNLMQQAEPLIRKYGDDQKGVALQAVGAIEQRASSDPNLTQVLDSPAAARGQESKLGLSTPLARERSGLRDRVYRVIAQLRRAADSSLASKQDRAQAKRLLKQIGQSVEYAPAWVRLMSALCLGIGTMIGYRRIVTTLGERLGNVHLTPAQGASAELISSVLIGLAGFTGLPVSTTHVVTAGIGGTMVTSGAGLRWGMIRRIVLAWVLTLPVTILISGALYYALASPQV